MRVVQRRGGDFRRRSGAAVDQHRHGQLSRMEAAPGKLERFVSALVELMHGTGGIGQKATQQLVGRLQAAAAVVAQIENQALYALRVELVQATIEVRQQLGA